MTNMVDKSSVNTAKDIIKNALMQFVNKNYEECERLTNNAHELFIKEKSPENISICLSIKALLIYLKNRTDYKIALENLKDAKYLADFTGNQDSKLVNELFSGYIDLLEKNNDLAFLHYNNAKNFAQKHDEFGLLDTIIQSLEGMSKTDYYTFTHKRDPLMSLVKIGQAVNAETDINSLLKVIAEETKEAIEADRCSVFLYDKSTNELWSKIALGLESHEIRFNADKGLAGHVVKTGETINIKDAYNDSRFNKEIDKQTGYHTKTILCMPIKNLNQEIIGAFQVLNKLNGYFTAEDEDLLVAIGSSAGIALENTQLFEKQKEMFKEQKIVFESFIETLAASIDARDKITAGHSSRVRLYSKLIAQAFELDDKSIEVIEKAATLHDIGKIGIRDVVLQKEGKLTDEEYKHIQEHVTITHDILGKIHMSDDFKMISEIACSHHEKYNGTGYYRKLKGEEIPFGGRVLAVSDVFDAITSKRHYRDKMPMLNVIDLLIHDSGSHFDKEIVDKFLTISCDKIVEVFLTENHLELKDSDRKILETYNLNNLFEYLKQDFNELRETEQNFVNIFNMYYLGNMTVDGQKKGF